MTVAPAHQGAASCILVVDDNADNRDRLTWRLGYADIDTAEIRAAKARFTEIGAEAIGMAEIGPPDLLNTAEPRRAQQSTTQIQSVATAGHRLHVASAETPWAACRDAPHSPG